MRNHQTIRIDYPTLVATVEELLKDHQDLLLRFNAFFAVEPKKTIPPEANKGDSKGSVCARVKRVLKGHPNLLRGFRVFVPARSTITIASTKAEQRAASDNNKRIRVANFITKLKARFQGDDRHVYESFLEILTMYQEGNKSVNDLYQEVIALLQGHEDLVMEFEDVLKKPTDPSGVDNGSVIARMTELIRGYPKLLRGSRVFLPEAEITIPPKAEQRPESDGDQKKCADLENHMNKLETRLDTLVFPTMTEKTYEGKKSIKELHEEVVFLSEDKITIPPKADRTIPSEANKTIPPEANKGVDKDSVIARVEELTKDHRDLLLGLSAFLPAATKTIPHKADELTSLPEANRATPPKASRTIPLKFKITIPPKARRTIPSEAEKPTHSDELNFMNKLKTRFQRIDNHVVGSFRSIMKMYEEGKKSVKDVHEEVYDLLYYHEDLIEDFTRIFPKLGSFRINISTSTTSVDSMRLKIDEANGSAMMAEIIKGHPNLLLRLGVFFPKYSVNKHKGKRTIPPDDEHGGSAESSTNKKNRAANFMENLEARFQGDGGHVVNSVLQIIRMYTIEGNKSKNEAYHEVVALLHGHVDLIMEFGEYFSDILSQPKYDKLSTITITSPKAEQRAASDNNKRIRVANFITKLKARFQGDDRHVYESFLEILTMYQEGNKSVTDLYQEVIALLQGHEDLVMEFADVLKKPTDPSGSKSNANFMENLEARFQGDGGHVVKSVLQILRMYTIEGNKSKNEAYHECSETDIEEEPWSLQLQGKWRCN
ncbi:unnamed protein product [Arabidopsis arenosa]|uniref:Uncharacterized protein n=1 Tax=Arabidopsis arenosa TaxID=38785 RepID=A0A8S1ZM83_ARAAE|nr:unnamed protein product [Arabidopsis arenosa]